MARWKYRKPEPATERGVCVLCKRNPQKTRGGGKYRPLCSLCDKKEYSPVSRRKTTIRYLDKKRRPYRSKVKDKCERCGFVPEHSCQLDVDHIDTDHTNNAPENLQTLCANCHRLKTLQERQ